MANLDLCLGGVEPIYPPGPGRWVNVIPLEAKKNGNFVAPDGYAFSPVGVNVDNSMKDVTFYDYDGSVIASYTAEDFLALEEMPSNPEHEGLVAQGWNWSLSDAKAHVTKYDKLNIGQMYTTDDGKTRLYSDRIVSGSALRIYMRSSVVGGATIDWGDGTSTVTDSASAKLYAHTYNDTIENPVVTITVTSGNVELGGKTSGYIEGGKILKKVEIGTGIQLLSYGAFYRCYSLESVTIPNTVTSIYTSAFYECERLLAVILPSSIAYIQESCFSGCYSLGIVVLPKAVSSISKTAFNNCYGLKSITPSDSLTSIGESAFYCCYALKDIILPSSLTSIGSGCFMCTSLETVRIPQGVTSIPTNSFGTIYALTDVYLVATTPPTYNFAAFGVYNSLLFHVPAESVDAYKAASGWSDYAARIVPM